MSSHRRHIIPEDVVMIAFFVFLALVALAGIAAIVILQIVSPT